MPPDRQIMLHIDALALPQLWCLNIVTTAFFLDRFSPSQLWILNPKRLLVHETDEVLYFRRLFRFQVLFLLFYFNVFLLFVQGEVTILYSNLSSSSD